MNELIEESKRQPELDGIRGLAILGVLLSHGVGLTGLFGKSALDILIAFFLVPLWGGVDLFFVLSGFLITRILLRTKTQPNYFSSFYIRRVLRIFPIYYLALLCTLVASRLLPSLADALPAWNSWRIAYFCYLQNWPIFWHGQKIMGGIWGAYWSLAVEEQFYLLWPLAVYLLSDKTAFRICCAGIACSLPLRIYLCHQYFQGSFGLAQITPARFDGLLFGAACAIYMQRYKRPVPTQWVAGLAILGTAIMLYIGVFHPIEFVVTNKWMTTLGITGFALISTAIVASSQRHSELNQRLLTNSWLRKLGKYSYGIYVYHLFIFLPVRWYLLGNPGPLAHLTFFKKVLLMAIEIFAVILVAKLSYGLFESRFLRLKRHFEISAKPAMESQSVN